MTDIQIVAVGQKEPSAGKRHHARRRMDLDTAFAVQVVADPHVVVARKEDDPDTAIGQLGQLAQRAHKALRHHTPVFEPEIEKVPQQKDRPGILGRPIEPRQKTAFTDSGLLRGSCSQMNIRGKIDHRLRVICSTAPREKCRKDPWQRYHPCGRSDSWPAACGYCTTSGPKRLRPADRTRRSTAGSVPAPY